MPAQLELLPRKSFELTLSDGSKVQGQFGTFALAIFGEKKKIGLGKLMELFTGDPAIHDMLDFVLSATEAKEREAGQPVKFNRLGLSKWIDDYTEDTGEQGVLVRLFNHSAGAKEDAEKKKEPDIPPPLNGLSLSESQPARELAQ